MFDAGEWNDNPEAQALTESLVSTQKRKAADAKQEKGAISRRKRLKRNRQLIEVLQTLKSSNAQNPDLPPPLEDVCPPGKQKKITPDIIPEQSSTSKPDAPPPDTGTRLSRKQWKNKMKNKKKNRNKFKPCMEKQKTADSREDGESRTGPQPGNIKRSSNKEKEETELLGGGATDKDGEQKKATSGDRKCESASPRMTAVEKARLEKLKKLLKKEQARKKKDVTTEVNPEDTADPDDTHLPEEEEGTDRSASLRSRMEQRLHSARFRYINEQLYTSDSQEAVQLFQNDPEAFNIYHTGFSQQVQRWPVSPITEIIKYVKNRPPSLVVADFGCGDARLARSVRNKVHSFDLVALNDHVTVCDIAQVPLSDETVDIAVFCLSLMGKNLSDFLKEANRVLKMEGVLLVAEVSSRFDDVRQFMTAMSQLGFKCVNKNTENSHFYLFEFSKVRVARDASKHPGLQLKPCLYKKR